MSLQPQASKKSLKAVEHEDVDKGKAVINVVRGCVDCVRIYTTFHNLLGPGRLWFY